MDYIKAFRKSLQRESCSPGWISKDGKVLFQIVLNNTWSWTFIGEDHKELDATKYFDGFATRKEAAEHAQKTLEKAAISLDTGSFLVDEGAFYSVCYMGFEICFQSHPRPTEWLVTAISLKDSQTRFLDQKSLTWVDNGFYNQLHMFESLNKAIEAFLSVGPFEK